MKHSFSLTLIFILIIFSSASTYKKEESKTHAESANTMNNDKIKIKVNSHVFTATLLDNNTAIAFKELLPMTINMIELNGNEKYFDLTHSLITNSSRPKTIKEGDLMLFGSKTLVLFYKAHSTTYSYTKLGTVDNIRDLSSALGSGNVTVTFELE
ncbi:cyclophilin-like fold protein [Albibacterium bauzanense]|uniref:Cyclophilin-like domain-containing protein n=1 Tax=Albibacterium bauzanense TaxID=653929 RepID=A0A4R1LPI3_9SPHI|nr:cyclophilin-like fold protein [Albibacterium bauzanense]TCK80652.1 hypothetical protein C8N28_2397 [Albibacterium bauzanense]